MRMLIKRWPKSPTPEQLAAKASQDERRLADLRRRARAIGIYIDSVRPPHDH